MASRRRTSEDIDILQLAELHPDKPHPSGLSRRERFNVWVFLRDLIVHGPAYFRQFAKDLEEPEDFERIPVVKSKQVPARAMAINQSTVQGNANAILNLCEQGGIGDRSSTNATAETKDISDHVVLVHGDLSTCERVQSLQKSRGEEKTPWLRYQFVVFILGLFHLKMACADAIWKLFIFPQASRHDETSLFKQVAEIRPKETGKIGSKPGFRRMHEVIQHVGIVSRLDCWRTSGNAFCGIGGP